MAENKDNPQGHDLSAKAIDQLRAGVYPSHWKCIPTSRKKETWLKEWQEAADYTHQDCITSYITNSGYVGVGVVTGALSGGIICLDIDGPEADKRYKHFAKHEYEKPGYEQTMVTSSGREGRRQIFYQVPFDLIDSLSKLVKLINDPNDWDTFRPAKGEGNKKEGTTTKDDDYQEFVIRYNRVMSVLPGSVHPITGRYHWVKYNDGIPAKCPKWLLELIVPYRDTGVDHWVERAKRLHLGGVVSPNEDGTTYPTNQIRGGWYKKERQNILIPKLEDVIFKHDVFEEWKAKGDGVHAMNFCPWHGGDSGTSFQVNTETGDWFCFGCECGGDQLNFQHRVNMNQINHPDPEGVDLERIVKGYCDELGWDYEQEWAPKITTHTTREVMSADAFLAQIKKIYETEKNPGVRNHKMTALAADSYLRYSAADCIALLDASETYEQARKDNSGETSWWEGLAPSEYIIPDLIKAPSQTIMASRPGVGKTSTALGIARAVGTGSVFKVRGLNVKLPGRKVLWIQNDQPAHLLMENLEDNGIDVETACQGPNKWLYVKRHYQMEHLFELRDWIREINPGLVVIDSIGSCSTASTVQEKDKAFANPLYWVGQRNGLSDERGGFPPCAFLYLHHFNKSGTIRGTEYLAAAVDETWVVAKPSEEQATTLTNAGRKPYRCRVIEIEKSRSGREGDQLITEKDADEAFSTYDWTAMERAEAENAPPDPKTTVLAIINRLPGLTSQQIWEELRDIRNGINEDCPSHRTVSRMIKKWEARKLVLGQKIVTHKKGKPAVGWYVRNNISNHPPRVGMEKEVSLTQNASDPLQENGSIYGHESEGVSKSEEVSITPPEDEIPMEWVDLCITVTNRFGSDGAKRVSNYFPGLARLFEALLTKATPERDHAREEVVSEPPTQPGEVTNADSFEDDFG